MIQSYFNKLPHLSVEQIQSKVACVLVDSDLQKELHDAPDHPEAWLLDFVYDSQLRDQMMSFTNVEEIYSPFNS